MVNPELLEEQAINIATVSEEFKKIKKRDKELNYRMTKMQEYLDSFSHLDVKKAEELYKKITALEIPRIRDSMIHKLIDLLPKTTEEIKLIFQGSPITISKEHIEELAKIMKEYA